MKTIPVLIRMDPEKLAQVDSWASRHGMSRNGAINHALQDLLDQEQIWGLLKENAQLRQQIASITKEGQAESL